MTDYPLVSCLMPTTASRSVFWERAISMFAAQDYPRKELIIIEDEAGAFECPQELPRSVWKENRIWNLPEYGAASLGGKLNRGARWAHGEILINWDDDDWNAPDRISTQVRHMQITGKPVVGLSSLIYYAEGREFGYEYTGDAWYASGSSHCYTRDWVLAHPRPDKTVGEDNDFAAEARKHGAISNLSGLNCLVACDHPGNCSARMFGTELYELIRETSSNFRKIPLAEFASTIGPYGSH